MFIELKKFVFCGDIYLTKKGILINVDAAIDFS